MSCTGIEYRLARIFCLDGRALIFPVDDALIAGPLGALSTPTELMSNIVRVHGVSVLAFPGTFGRFLPSTPSAPRIVNLTASTTRAAHTRKVVVSSIERALAAGADAVAFHVNVTSKFEHEMLSAAGIVLDRAHAVGLPVVGILYPRTEGPDGDNNYVSLRDADELKYTELVVHCARIGVELGVDVVKTVFTGSAASFAHVAQACAPVPVVVAGGPLLPVSECIAMGRAALEGGAAGLSFGRNVFLREAPASVLDELRVLLAPEA